MKHQEDISELSEGFHPSQLLISKAKHGEKWTANGQTQLTLWRTEWIKRNLSLQHRLKTSKLRFKWEAMVLGRIWGIDFARRSMAAICNTLSEQVGGEISVYVWALEFPSDRKLGDKGWYIGLLWMGTRWLHDDQRWSVYKVIGPA